MPMLHCAARMRLPRAASPVCKRRPKPVALHSSHKHGVCGQFIFTCHRIPRVARNALLHSIRCPTAPTTALPCCCQGTPDANNAGIIPRAVELILSRVDALAAQEWQYSLGASFIEVYNNTLR